MDEFIKLIKFLGVSSLTILSIVYMYVRGYGFAGGVILLITIFFIIPGNMLICLALYYWGINDKILGNIWMPVFESCTYLSLLFLIYKVKFPLLEQYGLYDFIAKLLFPYVIIIPLLLIHKLICKWLIKFKSK